MTLTRDELRKIPKVELHRHLELSFRLPTLLELAKDAGIEVPTTDAGIREKFLVTEPMLDLESVLNKFLVTQKVLSSEDILTRLTRECIEDCVREGTRIVELRYAPTFIQEGHPDLSFEKIHAAIVRGIEQTRELPIAVGLLATVQRIRSLADAERVIDFVISHRDSFVGVDLADNESAYQAEPFAPVFAKAKKAGLGITIHAGESFYPGMVKAVTNAIEVLGAQRIGHGLQIHTDPAAMEFVRKHNVPLELCPTSNWLTNAVKDVKEHPFRKLMEAGVPVTINTDDPGVFGIDLLNEYEVLARDHKMTRAEFDRCNDIAAKASFIPLTAKQKVWPREIV